MKKTGEPFDQLELAYEPTPEAFHHRVQTTLAQMDSESAPIRPVRRIRWAAALAAVLALASAIAVAANQNRIIDFITHTAAKSRVTDAAQNLLHTNAASAALGDCSAGVAEWMCDGETLYTSIRVTDPALRGADAAHYALEHGPKAASLSNGEAGGISWDFAREGEEELLYTMEAPIKTVSDAFTAAISISSSQGTMTLSFEVERADFGGIRTFEPSAVLRAEGYTAQIAHFKTTALHSYAALEMVFDESVSEARRHEIAADYQAGLGVPEGKLDTVAGEGEEIVMARTAEWSENGLTCTIHLLGNPLAENVSVITYCPRWGMHAYEDDGEAPALSMDGAITMTLKEVRK